MIIDKKHIILFWILGLILFTFYCIFRIKHIREKYDDITLATEPKTIIDYINTIQLKTKDFLANINVFKDFFCEFTIVSLDRLSITYKDQLHTVFGLAYIYIYVHLEKKQINCHFVLQLSFTI